MTASDLPSLPQGLFIHVEHPSKRINTEGLQRLLLHVIEHEGASVGHVNIVLAGHATVHALNREYLAHDYITDVLAFPLEEESSSEDTISGEIYVDVDTAADRHAEFGATFEEETYRYAVHGLLHLLGYTDKSPPQKAVMQKREEFYLNAYREG